MTINHESNDLYEILGLDTEEELIEYLENEDLSSDISFFITCMDVAIEEQASVYLLSKVLGRDLKRPSEVAEYYVKHITDEETRAWFITIRASEAKMPEELGS